MDTPGIDGRDRAIDRRGSEFDTADAIVWVVDGLQPLTRTERDVVELLRLPETPMVCVVSKADLLGDEVEAVLSRVRTGAEAQAVAADLRTETPILPEFGPIPRRRRELAEAVSAVESRFARVARPVSDNQLVAKVDVRAAVRPWLARWNSRSERLTVSEMVADFGSGLEARVHTRYTAPSTAIPKATGNMSRL